ncbi:MAG: 6-phosphofructokinase, partial [Armatimonadota bacterium]
TAVINSSLAGVVLEALEHEAIEDIFGMVHGVEGLLREQLIDLGGQSAATIAGLRGTPSAALGSGRYKLTDADYERLLGKLAAYNIRYFIYIGGNDSADTAARLGRLAAERGYDLRVMSVPKTVDNDLVETDHCPGYGSVARWLAIAVRDAGLDTEAIGVVDTVKVVETMGRNTGWITAATALARDHDDAAPHLIYLPERPLVRDRFLADVERVYRRLGHAVIAVCEGLRDERGEYVSASGRAVDVDRFGHKQLGGVAGVLCALVTEGLGLKARWDKPGTIQRVSMVAVSPVDLEEAYEVGRAAVRHAVGGQDGTMVTLVRVSSDPYRWTTGLAPLERVANAERSVPDEFIAADGNDVTEAFLMYARPLIGGPLPPYVRLERTRVAQRTG